MTLNDILMMQQAIDILETVLDASPDEIIECLEKRLISEEEAGQLRSTYQ